MDYSNSMGAAAGAGFAGAMIIYYIIILAYLVVSIVGMWKMFVKAGRPGWASLIPYYNNYCLFDLAWGNGWLFLLTLIPCVNFVVYIILAIKTASAFGKGTGFGICTIFFAPICYMILGFGDAEYIGPQ